MENVTGYRNIQCLMNLFGHYEKLVIILACRMLIVLNWECHKNVDD
jgi:hypothetical protein